MVSAEVATEETLVQTMNTAEATTTATKSGVLVLHGVFASPPLKLEISATLIVSAKIRRCAPDSKKVSLTLASSVFQFQMGSKASTLDYVNMVSRRTMMFAP